VQQRVIGRVRDDISVQPQIGVIYIEGGEDGGLEVLDVEGRDDDVGEGLVHPRRAQEALDLGAQELAVVFRPLELDQRAHDIWPWPARSVNN
jgi:hypothetical protein